jgi:hypothetical protein
MCELWRDAGEFDRRRRRRRRRLQHYGDGIGQPRFIRSHSDSYEMARNRIKFLS